jgi:hypothetical protein
LRGRAITLVRIVGNIGSASNVWVWHQSTELYNVESADAAAEAAARWVGEAALRNAGHGPVAEQAASAAVAPDEDLVRYTGHVLVAGNDE